MSDDRMPAWPWIVAALTALALLYVTSFGLTCGLVERGILNPSILRSGVFSPCYRAFRGPEPVRTLARGWVRIFGGEEAMLIEIAADALEEVVK